MACWRVLELSQQPTDAPIPQLLVKPNFKSNAYTLHLTCLSNIWSEELTLDEIVHRALQAQSPIEVSKQDTTQLAILLENVEKSLGKSGDAVCRIARADDDGVTIHTSMALPAPLDCLTWKFNLTKRNSSILKNELILPLLFSSHIQHERISRLIAIVTDKDKAMTRLMDQYESSNLDLAAAFPVISGLKSGRKAVKREQAAKHVPALQPFRADEFQIATSTVEDPDITTLGLFQEALSDCSPIVPAQLRSDDKILSWWQQLPKRLGPLKATSSSKPIIKNEELAKVNVAHSDGESGDETEDEFETHENFKSRRMVKHTIASADSASGEIKDDSDVTDDTEDDEDLDAPPSQRSSKAAKAAVVEAKADSPPPAKTKSAGFRIGGRSKDSTVTPSPGRALELDGEVDHLPMRQLPSSSVATAEDISPKKAKRSFKIGGKSKVSNDGSSQPVEGRSNTGDDRTICEPAPAMPASSSPPNTIDDDYPAEKPAREETAEEKAERRRAELKRKTAEASKKQAQQKKKRRF